MAELTTSAAQIAALKEAYAALNRNDTPAFMKVFDAHVVRIEFEGTPQGGTYRGLAAVTEHVAKARATWAEGACEPQRFLVVQDKIVVFTHVRVRLKHETEWREGDTFDVFTFRDGKVIEFRTFLDERQALEFAGTKMPEIQIDQLPSLPAVKQFVVELAESVREFDSFVDAKLASGASASDEELALMRQFVADAKAELADLRADVRAEKARLAGSDPAVND